MEDRVTNLEARLVREVEHRVNQQTMRLKDLELISNEQLDSKLDANKMLQMLGDNMLKKTGDAVSKSP